MAHKSRHIIFSGIARAKVVRCDICKQRWSNRVLMRSNRALQKFSQIQRTTPAELLNSLLVQPHVKMPCRFIRYESSDDEDTNGNCKIEEIDLTGTDEINKSRNGVIVPNELNNEYPQNSTSDINNMAVDSDDSIEMSEVVVLKRPCPKSKIIVWKNLIILGGRRTNNNNIDWKVTKESRYDDMELQPAINTDNVNSEIEKRAEDYKHIGPQLDVCPMDTLIENETDKISVMDSVISVPLDQTKNKTHVTIDILSDDDDDPRTTDDVCGLVCSKDIQEAEDKVKVESVIIPVVQSLSPKPATTNIGINRYNDMELQPAKNTDNVNSEIEKRAEDYKHIGPQLDVCPMDTLIENETDKISVMDSVISVPLDQTKNKTHVTIDIFSDDDDDPRTTDDVFGLVCSKDIQEAEDKVKVESVIIPVVQSLSPKPATTNIGINRYNDMELQPAKNIDNVNSEIENRAEDYKHIGPQLDVCPIDTLIEYEIQKISGMDLVISDPLDQTKNKTDVTIDILSDDDDEPRTTDDVFGLVCSKDIQDTEDKVKVESVIIPVVKSLSPKPATTNIGIKTEQYADSPHNNVEGGYKVLHEKEEKEIIVSETLPKILYEISNNNYLEIYENDKLTESDVDELVVDTDRDNYLVKGKARTSCSPEITSTVLQRNPTDTTNLDNQIVPNFQQKISVKPLQSLQNQMRSIIVYSEKSSITEKNITKEIVNSNIVNETITNVDGINMVLTYEKQNTTEQDNTARTIQPTTSNVPEFVPKLAEYMVAFMKQCENIKKTIQEATIFKSEDIAKQQIDTAKKQHTECIAEIKQNILSIIRLNPQDVFKHLHDVLNEIKKETKILSSSLVNEFKDILKFVLDDVSQIKAQKMMVANMVNTPLNYQTNQTGSPELPGNTAMPDGLITEPVNKGIPCSWRTNPNLERPAPYTTTLTTNNTINKTIPTYDVPYPSSQAEVNTRNNLHQLQQLNKLQEIYQLPSQHASDALKHSAQNNHSYGENAIQQKNSAQWSPVQPSQSQNLRQCLEACNLPYCNCQNLAQGNTQAQLGVNQLDRTAKKQLKRKLEDKQPLDEGADVHRLSQPLPNSFHQTNSNMQTQFGQSMQEESPDAVQEGLYRQAHMRAQTTRVNTMHTQAPHVNQMHTQAPHVNQMHTHSQYVNRTRHSQTHAYIQRSYSKEMEIINELYQMTVPIHQSYQQTKTYAQNNNVQNTISENSNVYKLPTYNKATQMFPNTADVFRNIGPVYGNSHVSYAEALQAQHYQTDSGLQYKDTADWRSGTYRCQPNFAQSAYVSGTGHAQGDACEVLAPSMPPEHVRSLSIDSGFLSPTIPTPVTVLSPESKLKNSKGCRCSVGKCKLCVCAKAGALCSPHCSCLCKKAAVDDNLSRLPLSYSDLVISSVQSLHPSYQKTAEAVGFGKCESCNTVTNLSCTGCYQVFYCSYKCSTADWNLQHHKKCK